ncbi:FAD-dependent oxidoreductase [Cohnella abietis]|uniref:Flavin-dependent monooxygenase n=1 Tax=Cohnella abietis TaxID=2507935 RepID=A0A3T1D432_9BACL|nr:NAD(P)/FAD-dependent oxidoreductase [Cohnella abietis]BBI32798.1 FAD-dependent oxidoreductase [Cohnella abietis]
MNNLSKRIAIIGAGPGGLTLARVLQEAGYNPVVYEGEASRNERQQGGTLDLETDSGQKALQLAGLLESFYQVCRFEGQSTKIVDKSGKVYQDDTADEVPGEDHYSRPEIDRTVLRDLLLDSLRPDTIQWGYKCLEATPVDDHRFELHFENGKTDVVDLVVAADGAFSRIRPLVSEEKAEYSGVSMIELNILDAANESPELTAYNGPGTVYALDDHKGIMAQMNGDGRIRVYLGFQAGRDFLESLDIPYDEPEKAKPKLVALFADWADELQKYITSANDVITPRRIYMLPVSHTWESRAGVTLIGDAAHLMSPFAGAGANLAMLDGAELALSIINNDDLDTAVRQYELKMFEYAGATAAETKENMELFFSDNAAARLGELMNSFAEQ